MSRLSIALSVFILPIGFQSIPAQSTETKAGTATISGKVLLNGEPARAVTVILQGQVQDPSNSLRAKSGDDGRFKFNGVVAGSYTIMALVPGYITTDDTYFGISRGKPINIAEGEKVENVDLEIKRGGVIAGRVADSQGRPVIEESIYLSRIGKNNQPQSYSNYSGNYDMHRTDDRGAYRIYGLPEGRYLLSVGVAEGAGSRGVAMSREFYPRVFYPNVTAESEAKVIEVAEGSETIDVDITVPDAKQAHDVSGRVVDAATGQPVAGVEVAMGGVSKDGRSSVGVMGIGASSNSNGEFHLIGALPGKYAIFAGANGLGGSSVYISDPVIFDVSEGDVSGIEIKVSQGASISGVAIIEGTNDPKVLAKLSQINISTFIRATTPGPPTPSSEIIAKINADGSFRIDGLRPGKAIISVVPMLNARDISVARIERNGTPAANDGIEIASGEQLTGVRVILVHSALTLRGELKIVGGSLPPSLKFYATARKTGQGGAQFSRGAEIDVRGLFVFEYLAPGEYEIGVSPMNSQDNQTVSQEIRRLISSVKEKVALSGGNQQQVTLVINLSQ